MGIQKVDLNSFEQYYKDTYKDILKYAIYKCSNIEDVNDIIQDVYIEFYKLLRRKESIELNNINAFVLGIAKNKIKQYYGLKHKLQENLISNDIDELEYKDSSLDINIEELAIDNINAIEIWNYVKKKKGLTGKIFYLYFALDMKIKDIAKELETTETITKNYLYRTIRELNTILKKGE